MIVWTVFDNRTPTCILNLKAIKHGTSRGILSNLATTTVQGSNRSSEVKFLERVCIIHYINAKIRRKSPAFLNSTQHFSLFIHNMITKQYRFTQKTFIDIFMKYNEIVNEKQLAFDTKQKK